MIATASVWPTTTRAQTGAEPSAPAPVPASSTEPFGPIDEAPDTTKVGERSSGGTDRGRIEFALGGLTGAASLMLIGFGIRELVFARQLENYCQSEHDSYTEDCWLDPPRVKRVAAGLNFGISVPLMVASSLLLRQGVRIHRDYKAFHAQTASIGLVGDRDGARLSLTLRF